MKISKVLKVIAVILLIPAVILLLLVICFISHFRHKQQLLNTDKNMESAAKEQVTAYLQEKYGFEAEFVNSVQEIYRVGFAQYKLGNDFLFDMKLDDREFSVVCVAGECGDDFQADEIRARISDVCNAALPGIKSVEVEMTTFFEGNDDDDHYLNMMFRKRFDGNNINELLGERRYEVKAYYLSTDLSPLENTHAFDSYLENEDCKFTFYSCRSEEKLGLRNSHIDELLADSIVEMDKDSVKRSNYDIGSFGEHIEYVTTSGDITDVHFSEVPAGSSSLSQYKLLSPVYSIKAYDEVGVYIYYPAAQILNNYQWDDLSVRSDLSVRTLFSDHRASRDLRPIDTDDGEVKYLEVSFFLEVGEETEFAIVYDNAD